MKGKSYGSAVTNSVFTYTCTGRKEIVNDTVTRNTNNHNGPKACLLKVNKVSNHRYIHDVDCVAACA